MTSSAFNPRHACNVRQGFAALACFTVMSCAGLEARQDAATAIAAKGGLMRQDITAASFVLASWQKHNEDGRPVTIYIEGDGLAWLDRRTPSANPTPKNPVGLALAQADPGPNVVYLARPCQYTPLTMAGNDCRPAFWLGKRFSAEVIDSYMRVLDKIAVDHGAPGFHLVGYSGGANIAGLLAARRADVLSVRTVAGNVDNDFFTAFHGVSDMPLSLNMADDAAILRNVPQYHFIGGQDEYVPAAIYNSYAVKVGPSPCLQVKTIDGNGHGSGWAEQWPALLSLPLSCTR